MTLKTPTLPIEAIVENVDALRPAQVNDPAYAELKAHIAENGIHTPLLVRPSDVDGKYILIDGAQRFSCAKELGLADVPVNVIKTTSDEQVYLMQVSANITRIESKPAHLAGQIKRLMLRDPFLTQDKLCAQLKKSPSWLAGILRLNGLTKAEKELVDSGQMSLIAAQNLSRLPEGERASWIDRALTLNATDFVSHVDARCKEIAKARREGRDPNAVAQFVPVVRVRKLAEIKDVYDNPAKLASLVGGTTDPTEAAQAVIRYVLSLDPETVSRGKLAFEQAAADKAKAREARAANKSGNALVTAAKTLLANGVTVDQLPPAVRKAYEEHEAAAKAASAEKTA